MSDRYYIDPRKAEHLCCWENAVMFRGPDGDVRVCECNTDMASIICDALNRAAMNAGKTARTNVTSRELATAQGGAGGGDDFVVVTCPNEYDPAKITAEDIVHDDRIQVVVL